MNWKWPKTKYNGYNPWYKIVWRLVWAIPMFMSFWCTCLLMSISYGKKEGQELFRRYW